MSPALNGSSAIWRFEGSDAIEIRNEITFDFYTGLPDVHFTYKSIFAIEIHAVNILNKAHTECTLLFGRYCCGYTLYSVST